jgi:murein DD-endopeptidase MepM/ murein hydrolase activator NlpD
MIKKSCCSIFFIAVLLLNACSVTTKQTIPPTGTPQPPTATTVPTTTDTPLPTDTPTPTSTPDPSAGFMVSSPLQDIKLSELKEIVSNPFNAPSPGMDDGHHGVDLSYYSRGSHSQMLGIGIYSVFPGKVAATVTNRPPYGNMIIVETTFSAIPPQFLAVFKPPSVATPFPYNPRFIGCESLKDQSWSETPSSIYILYAHMKDPAGLKVGDPVKSGDLLGQVGNTGESGNPHLHLEMRLGPSGTEFASLSHYNTAATDEERLNYCTWRISGKYILLNPMDVIENWLNFQQTPQ